MNKRRLIWLFVILIIVILLGSVVIKHRNSIAALFDSFRYSQEEVVQKLNENKQQLQQYIDENENITVRDLTEEEAQSLKDGKLTEEEAVEILTGQEKEEKSPEDSGEKPAKPDTSENTPDSLEKSPDTVVSESIAKLYIQKNKYLGKLDAIEGQLYSEYYSLVTSNNMSQEEMKTAKQQMINSNISKVAAWENECDSVVYGILDEIETALKQSNQDTSIVKKLEEAYLNEKRLKKSYFISRYMD